ncbi:hypothetical protein A8C32_09450 [Flavivirga aquatica]|uniref:DUF6973 domain-containing protein n=2 Tax=Flavivirga aquatica TaxID=1849968 RepID=A0A1E5SJZ4_9FLAO|nr:hypothetical protein A8C32_09450 [Flavivirga aquatica]
MYAFYSPYSFSGNRVVDMIELEGLEPTPVAKGSRYYINKLPLNPVEGQSVKKSTSRGGYSLKYHNGGFFTSPGWYTRLDYNFLTKKGASHPSASLNSKWKVGTPDWGGDGDLSTSAGVFSTNVHLGKNVDGNLRNAYRHVLWQASIAYEISSKEAELIGYTHESNPNADLLLGENVYTTEFKNLFQADEVIDLLNNRLGRKISDKLKQKQNNLNRKELALRVLEEFHKEGFYTAKKTENGYTIELTKLTDE